MATETERLEHEAEQTRSDLEQTLGELRARMSPAQLVDQATDYFRNSGGRVYLSNLRQEVVNNPLPIALVGAGIAWLALSGAIGRRNGGTRASPDWGRTAGMVDDLAHGGREPSAVQRAKEAAADWARDAGESIAETDDRWRERAEDAANRVGTAYDETVERARQAAEGWSDQASGAVQDAGATVREGAENIRERAGQLYEDTAHGVRSATRKVSQYGRAARDAVGPDGALLNFCREQPMLVAGLGIAVGAALGAMIPGSRVERQAMGDTSRKVQDRIKETATDTWRAVGGEAPASGDVGRTGHDREPWNEDRSDKAANDGGPTAARQNNTGRSEQPKYANRREGWDSDAIGAREAAADVEHGLRNNAQSANIDDEPRAPYAEAAEAGAAGPGVMPEREPTQRT